MFQPRAGDPTEAGAPVKLKKRHKQSEERLEVGGSNGSVSGMESLPRWNTFQWKTPEVQNVAGPEKSWEDDGPAASFLGQKGSFSEKELFSPQIIHF